MDDLEDQMDQEISIHALREEGDKRTPSSWQRNEHFYPRPPRGGRRARDLERNSDMIFLSTPSARRATAQFFLLRWAMDTFLSTPSARRATGKKMVGVASNKISIHALREEGDRTRRR